MNLTGVARSLKRGPSGTPLNAEAGLDSNRRSVPSWARNGTIAYCRWDGGPMEATKAFLSGWDYITDPAAVRAIDDWYGDRGFELLKEGGFNWIWLTWSCGFSEQSERFQQEIVRRFAKKCEEIGVHRTAYMSLCNLFVQDVKRHQPELLDVAQRDAEGGFVPYTAARYRGEPERVMACINNPGWRAQLKRRLSTAIDAGFDAAFYDNVGPWCQCAFCQEAYRRFTHQLVGRSLPLPKSRALVSPFFVESAAQVDDKLQIDEWQILQSYFADRINDVMIDLNEHAQSQRPDFLVYLNWHLYHHTFGPPALKALSSEDGLKCCYVGTEHRFPTSMGFQHRGYVSNAGVLRRMLATAEDWRPLRLQSHQTVGPYFESRDFELYSGQDWQRLIAECWCFRAAQEVFLEGNFQTRLYQGDETARDAWSAIAHYNAFQKQHASLWAEATRSDVAFAVLVADGYPATDGDWQQARVLTGLALEGLQFDVTLDHQLSADRLARYPLLWCPNGECLNDAGLDAIEEYLLAGGRVCISGAFAKYSGVGKPRTPDECAAIVRRLAASGGERFIHCGDDRIKLADLSVDRIPATLLEAQREMLLRVHAEGQTVLWTSWSLPDGTRLVFILNPNDRRDLLDVIVEAPGAEMLAWHTPDASAEPSTIESTADGFRGHVARLPVFGFWSVQ